MRGFVMGIVVLVAGSCSRPARPVTTASDAAVVAPASDAAVVAPASDATLADGPASDGPASDGPASDGATAASGKRADGPGRTQRPAPPGALPGSDDARRRGDDYARAFEAAAADRIDAGSVGSRVDAAVGLRTAP
ncbi:MAG: hypothetical protein IPL61_34910 [Myxococcales bacterium]|nr:hypothetical protein [Myxococcales bacterium]